MDSRIALSFEGALALLVLRRPDKQNAIDTGMLSGLEAACDAIEANADVRVAILAGEGKSFSAGGDINAWSALDPWSFGAQWVRHGHRVMARIARLRVPAIAVLSGSALGGGLELAAAADFRVAEEHARLGSPEPSLGMVPGWSGTQRMVRRFGAQIVRRMVIAGEVFTAKEALALGLVDQVVPTGAGMAAAREVAARIAARGPLAVQVAKQMIAAADGEQRDAAVEVLASAFIATTGDLAEGVDAFRQKRPPSFSAE